MGLISAVVIPDSESLSQDEALSSSLLGFISHIGITGNVFLSTQEIATEKEVLSLGIVLSAIELTACYIGGLDIDNDELATKLLDKGARVVFFNNVDENELKMKVLSSFPRDRVGLSSLKDEVTVSTLQEVVTECREYTSHFLFRLPISNDSIVEIKAQAKVLASKGTNIQISFLLTNNETAEQAVMIGSFHEYINSVFCPIIQTTSEEPLVMKSPYSKSSIIANIDLVDAFFGCLKSDRPDGLITTVVCDDHGVCLGLVYSNKKSVEAAIFERKGIYHSRSRGGLWRKGDTSGAYQELLALSYDCDGDALRFSVIQHGEPPCFCHLNTRTCWGPSHGIQHLQSVLKDRLLKAPVGSYTKRLFDDPNLLQKKLLEEVQELVEATEPDHVAAEAADVLYFMMTRCVAAGVGLREIEGHLDKRTLKVTRRPGNAKAWRSENAAQILDGKEGMREPSST